MTHKPKRAGERKNKILSVRTLFLVLTAVILGLGIYRWNSEVLVGNKLPMPFGYGSAVVLSGSMEPELSANDLIIVKKTNGFYEGQIVVYQSGDSMTVHRIVEIDGKNITTQGDANNISDDPITRDDIKGEVIFAVPNAGNIIDFLKNPAVTSVLLAASVLLMELSFRKDKTKERDELETLKKEIGELTKELKKEDIKKEDIKKDEIKK